MKTVLFIGLSNKINLEPLDSSTNSGRIVDQIIDGLDCDCHKINLVNFAPTDALGKLRYPNESELALGFSNLQKAIQNLKPNLCVLLGSKVSSYLKPRLASQDTIDIKHPSYVHVYKRSFVGEYVTNTVQEIHDHLY